MARAITTVKHLDPKHVVISPADGWTVTIFNIAKGRVIEAFVNDGGEETIKLTLEGPDDTYGVRVHHDDLTNETHVEYVERKPVVCPL